MTNSKFTILFRADANGQIGFGHLIRSIALAKILQKEFLVCFAIRKNATAAFFLEKDLPYIEIPENEDDIDFIINKLNFCPKIVVLDGYFFDTKYQKRWKNMGAKLVCIDDIHAFHFVADAIINHSGVKQRSVYSKEEYSQLYLGFNYSLLRDAFFTDIPSDLLNREKRFFLFLGGSSIKGITEKTLNSLIEIFKDEYQILFLKGAADIFDLEVKPILNKTEKITVFENLDDKQLCKLIDTCRFAFTPASSSSLEICARNVPLICGTTVENQQNLYHSLTTNEMCLGVGDLIQISKTELMHKFEDFVNNEPLQYKLVDNQKKNMKNVKINLISIFEKLI